MSAIGGILNFDGAPVNSQIMLALWTALASQGPDGGEKVQVGSLGVAYRAFHTNREDKLEKQPLMSCHGQVLAWDGRLDNREELLTHLGDDLYEDHTDVALVIASYLKWGIDFLPHLIGDFALSLWEPNTKTLLLARDAFGTRPIYYQANEERIIWSSELKSLLDLAGIDLEVDDEFVAGYLTNSTEFWRTPYKGMHSVQPGHVLIIRDAHVQEQEFWRPDPKHEIRYKTDSEYEEQFRDLFRQAVSCRLRADGPVWAELSGGLDSSSIVCMADHITEGNGGIPKLQTVSYVYDNSPSSDERRFISSVEERRKQAGHHFHEDDFLARFQNPKYSTLVRPNPIYRFTGRHEWVFAEMQKVRARVLLSGVCGDNLLWSGVDASPELADLLLRFQLDRLHRRLCSWCQADGRSYIGLLWQGAVFPILPRILRARYNSGSAALGLVDRKFAKRMGMQERLLGPPDPWGFSLPSGRAQASMLSAGIAAVSSCYYRDRVLTEYRYPFLHRPLVEFLMAVPVEQKLRPGETRSLHRRAMKDLLPDLILKRRGKRWSTEAFCRTLANRWQEVNGLFSDALVCAYEYVNPEALHEAGKRLQHGAQFMGVELTNILSVELWLRALERIRAPT